MKLRSLIVAATLASTPFAAALAADGVVVATEQGKAVIAGKASVTATIVAIDAATRTVTLKGENGETVDVVAGPEVKRFAELKVGDTLTTTFVEAVALNVKQGGGKFRQRIESVDAVRATADEAPGGAIGKKVVIIADVTAVDAEKGTITLRGPRGIRTMKVHNKAQLNDLTAGDQVEVTLIEAMAMEITHAK
ncbi:hypothetical protein OPU71_04585 [Niveibacterium sp. 24ML]|uniref:hypothetical protein n=1 Tax=Niveibacterium sp. 24ML TaxID=2985512 RepID=UPI00226FFD9A|nr:hypothetical protein [Niveibacterium sp. 24ML]MCX9155395.1 hypothetical protein [Niveibacterium sp. 24ML]